MKTQIRNFSGTIVETVTRYIGHEISLTDSLADDVGLDSIDRLNLMTAVEQAHDIELTDEEMASISTLQDLLRLTEAGSGKPGADTSDPARGAE